VRGRLIQDSDWKGLFLVSVAHSSQTVLPLAEAEQDQTESC
jgi:hypothetical protein